MPVGNQSYMGLAPALEGESEIRAKTTAVDILTITQSSGNDANYLVLRANIAQGSTATSADQFRIDSSGGLAQFKFAVNTTTLTTTSTAVSIGSTQSGQFFVGSSAGWSSGAKITLPAPTAGAFYTIMFQAAATSVATIIEATTAGTVDILIGAGSDAATTVGLNANSLAGEMGACISFLGLSASRYMALPFASVSSAYNSDAAASLVLAWDVATS